MSYFAPFRPKVKRVLMMRTCKDCGQKKPVNELAYAGPITDIFPEPSLFTCADKNTCHNPNQ